MSRKEQILAFQMIMQMLMHILIVVKHGKELPYAEELGHVRTIAMFEKFVENMEAISILET